MWIDVHCHLDYFQNPELAVEEAVSVGVEKIIANSTTLEGLHKVLALQKQFPENVKAALGYHPTHFIEDSKQKIEETFNHVIQHAPECIAFGEIGLDFDDKTSQEAKELQISIFKKFISLGREFKKPLIVHARGSRSEVLKILQEEKATRVLLHSFVAKEKQLKQLLALPFFVSVGAGVLNSGWIQDFAKRLPLEKMLLETDSPLEFSGEKCSPAWIPKIAQKIAELKGASLKEVEEKTFQNFRQLFGF